MLNKNKQFEVSSDVKEYIDIVQRKQSKQSICCSMFTFEKPNFDKKNTQTQ